jgi:hypothetical protein
MELFWYHMRNKRSAYQTFVVTMSRNAEPQHELETLLDFTMTFEKEIELYDLC